MLIQRLCILLFSLSMLIVLTVYGMSSPNIFQGRVLSPKGDPVERASIRINHNDDIIALTNKTGTFEFQTDKFVFSIEARSSLYPTYRAIWFPEHNQEDQFVLLVLKKPFDFQGRVTDNNKKPIKSAKVKVSSAGYFTQTGFGLISTLTTDTEGKFLIEDLVPDNQYQVEVAADNYQTFRTEPFIASRNWISQLSVIMLEPKLVTSSVLRIRPSPVSSVIDKIYLRSNTPPSSISNQMPRVSSVRSNEPAMRSTSKPSLVSEIVPGAESKNQVTVIVTDTAGNSVSGAKILVDGNNMVTDTTGKIEFIPARLGEININVNYNNVWYSKGYVISHPNDVIRIRVGIEEKPKQ